MLTINKETVTINFKYYQKFINKLLFDTHFNLIGIYTMHKPVINKRRCNFLRNLPKEILVVTVIWFVTIRYIMYVTLLKKLHTIGTCIKYFRFLTHRLTLNTQSRIIYIHIYFVKYKHQYKKITRLFTLIFFFINTTMGFIQTSKCITHCHIIFYHKFYKNELLLK